MNCNCIDCHTCCNYCIEDIEGSDWAVGICGIDKNRKLDPNKCEDYKEYKENETN